MVERASQASTPRSCDEPLPSPGDAGSVITALIQDDAATPYDQDLDIRLRTIAIELEKMVAGNRVIVGNIPTGNAGLISGWTTMTTFVTFEVRAHYQKRHLEMQQLDIELETLRTVIDPDLAMLDIKYPNSVNIFRSLDEGSDIMVSISISTSDSRQNRIKSARTHPKSRTNELLSDQNRNGGEWRK